VIDVETSDLVRYSSGAIMRVRRLEVRENEVAGATIFGTHVFRPRFS